MTNRNHMPEARRGERGIWNPMREMNRMQHQINRIFDSFFTEPFGPRDLLPQLEEEAEFAPACDVAENDTHYLISFDLPGVKKEDVKIDLRDNQLTVSGERKEES